MKHREFDGERRRRLIRPRGPDRQYAQNAKLEEKSDYPDADEHVHPPLHDALATAGAPLACASRGSGSARYNVAVLRTLAATKALSNPAIAMAAPRSNKRNVPSVPS